MKLFGMKFGAKAEAKAKSPTCYHPFEKCKALFEDPNDPKHRTGGFCAACGQRIE